MNAPPYIVAPPSSCAGLSRCESFQFRFDLIKDEVEAELGEIEPKAAKLQEKLAAMEFLIRSLPRRGTQVQLLHVFSRTCQEISPILVNLQPI